MTKANQATMKTVTKKDLKATDKALGVVLARHKKVRDAYDRQTLFPRLQKLVGRHFARYHRGGRQSAYYRVVSVDVRTVVMLHIDRHEDLGPMMNIHREYGAVLHDFNSVDHFRPITAAEFAKGTRPIIVELLAMAEWKPVGRDD